MTRRSWVPIQLSHVLFSLVEFSPHHVFLIPHPLYASAFPLPVSCPLSFYLYLTSRSLKASSSNGSFPVSWLPHVPQVKHKTTTHIKGNIAFLLLSLGNHSIFFLVVFTIYEKKYNFQNYCVLLSHSSVDRNLGDAIPTYCELGSFRAAKVKI